PSPSDAPSTTAHGPYCSANDMPDLPRSEDAKNCAKKGAALRHLRLEAPFHELVHRSGCWIRTFHPAPRPLRRMRTLSRISIARVVVGIGQTGRDHDRASG